MTQVAEPNTADQHHQAIIGRSSDLGLASAILTELGRAHMKFGLVAVMDQRVDLQRDAQL